METKKQLIETLKNINKWYAIPRGMEKRSKDELQQLYDKAKELGLINKR